MSTTIPSTTNSKQSRSAKKQSMRDTKDEILEARKFPSELVEKGWRLANEGRRFYAHNDSTQAMTVLHDTIEAAAEEASEIDARSQSYRAHEFTPKEDSKTICKTCFQGRNGKPHRAWKESQKKSDPASPEKASGAGETESQKRVMDLAFLADLEDEQKSRWALFEQYNDLRNQAQTKKDLKRLEREQKDVLKDYENAWDEAVKALDNNADIVQEVRDRIEAEDSTIATDADAPANGGCSPDCGHADEEHAAFDAGVKAGCDGADPDTCPYTDDNLRDAWLHGHSVNFNASTRPAETGESVTDQANAATPSQPLIFNKEIEVELADRDYKEKSRKLAYLRLQIEELQAEMKRTVDGYKQKIGGLEEECSEVFRSIRSGRDTLELDVYERRDFERKVVETVRVDTLDVVETRPMAPREFQQPLPSI